MSSPVIIGPVNPGARNTGPMFSGGPVNHEHAFPALTASQIDRIRPLGRIRQMAAGEILFEPGDISVPFFALLSGAMEIVQPGLNGERKIVTHQAGGFTGEMTMISRRGALARGRVTEAGEFLEVSAENLNDSSGAGRGTERDFYARFHPAAPAADFHRPGQCGPAGLTAFGQRHSACASFSAAKRASPSPYGPRYRRGSAGSAGPVFRCAHRKFPW